MSTPVSDVEFLMQALVPLVSPLYESLDQAADIAAAHFAEFDMDASDYHPCQSHLARAHARRILKGKESKGEIEPWNVTAPQPNVQVCLRRDLLRLLLLRPVGLQVPKPGTNAARRAYFSNHHVHLHGVRASKLIGLWAPDADGQIQLQVVRTIGEAPYSNHVPVDIQFWLPRDSSQIAELEFTPSDADMSVELPFEATEVGEEPESGANTD